MVPHLWIIECLDLFGVAENIKSLFTFSICFSIDSIKFDSKKDEGSI